MSVSNHKTLLIKNTSFNLIGHFYLAIASLIAIPITLKYLGTHQFASLALINTFVALSSLFHFGLHQATIRFLALHHQHPSKQQLYTLTAILNIFILTLILGSIGLICKPFITSTFHLSNHLFNLTFSLVFINYLTNFFNTFPQARNDFIFYNLKVLLVGTSNTLLTALFAFRFQSLTAIISIRLLFQILVLIFQLIYLKTHFSLSLQKLNLSSFISTSKNLFSFGLKKFLGLLSSQGVFHFPRIFISRYFPLDNLPLFTIPQGLIANIQASLSQLTTALFPLSTNLISQRHHRRLKRILIFSELLVISLFASFTLLVFIFGETFLSLWLHNPQLAHQIQPTFKLLALAYSLSALSAIPATLLDSLGKPEIPALFATFNLGLQICFLFLLTPKFGFIGVPLTILLHNLIQVPIFLIFFKHQFNKTIASSS